MRFDNAYYSVDKAYLHKSVLIAASATTVNIYSMKGELIVSWRRASRKGEWLTDPAHLPESYKQMSEWNATYFTRKAMTVGPNTVKVIEHILRSREHEVQTYRLCIGILNYTKKYSKLALEDCCKLALIRIISRILLLRIQLLLSLRRSEAPVSIQSSTKNGTKGRLS